MRESLFEALIGLVVVAVAGFFLVFSLSQRSDASTGDSYDLIAKFDRADGVSPGTDVRVAGVKVGTVRSVKLDQTTFKAEATLMELLGNHPHVVGFVGAVISDEHLALVTEFCPHGSLFDLLYKENHQFSEVELLTMARDTASALNHLHSEGEIGRAHV